MNYRGEGSMLRKFDNTWFAWKWRIVGAFVGIIMAAPLYIMMAKAGTVACVDQYCNTVISPSITRVSSNSSQHAEIWHVERLQISVNEYTNQRRCTIKRIPVYGESYQQGRQNSSGDLLGAMIIGGIFGHALSGNNDGAAAGAVMGALIQNDKANNSGTGKFIAGYEDREVCDIVRVQTPVYKDRYVVHWKWNSHRGHFISKKQWNVGQRVWVKVN